MQYRVTIEKVIEPQGESSYPKHEEIYQQIVDDLDVNTLVIAINQAD